MKVALNNARRAGGQCNTPGMNNAVGKLAVPGPNFCLPIPRRRTASCLGLSPIGKPTFIMTELVNPKPSGHRAYTQHYMIKPIPDSDTAMILAKLFQLVHARIAQAMHANQLLNFNLLSVTPYSDIAHLARMQHVACM